MKNKSPDLSLCSLSLVNGRLDNQLPVTDRGLQYGDGLFETILYLNEKLCLNGSLILLDQHLQRLSRDCQRLKIFIDKNILKKEIDFLLAEIKRSENTTGIVKIIVTRAYAGRGYGFINKGFEKHSSSNRILQYYAGLSYSLANRSGVRIGLTDYRLSDNKNLAGIKHLNRLDQVLLHARIRKPFYQEVIVCGAHGEILEGVFSNLFIVKNATVITPIMNKAGVQGVMRDFIFNDVCRALKLPSIEAVISLDDLLQADEVFICNSIFGVWPVSAIDVKSYAVGNTTLAIQNQVDRLGYQRLYS